MVGNGQNLPTTCVSCTLLTVSKLTKYNNLVIEFNALIISKWHFVALISQGHTWWRTI